MAGLFDGMWDNGGSGVLPSGSAYFRYPDEAYAQPAEPPAAAAAAGYAPGVVGAAYAPRAVAPTAGGYGAQPQGFMDRVNTALTNPLTLFGLGLASGKTPQEGIGNAAMMGLRSNQLRGEEQAKVAAYHAAIAQGATPEQAMALASNPAAFKALQPQFHTLKTGLFGEEMPVSVGPFGQIKQLNVGGAAGGAAGTDSPLSVGAVPENYDPETGKDEAFLQAVQNKYGAVASKSVQDVTEGRMPAMGRNLQQLIPLASRYDKNFTGMQDFQTRLQTAKSFAAGGKDYANVKSYNQATIHAEQAWDLIPKIENWNVGGPVGKMINSPTDAYRAANDPAYANNRKRYDGLIEGLSKELSKAAKTTGTVSVDEIRAWRQAATGANSGAEMRGAIQGGMDFLHGAMEATAQGHREGLKSQLQSRELLAPEREKAFSRIRDYQEGGKQTEAPKTNVPAVGEVRRGYRFKGGDPSIPDSWEKQ